MKTKYRISVIIPTWNRGKLLEQAVQSALNQTFQPLEVIVCDDGSTDDSIEALETNFAEQILQKKLRILRCGRNRLPAIVRNIGIKNSRGNWIAFLDSDDYWLPEKLEKQVNFLENNTGIKAICTNAFRINTNGTVLGNYFNLSANRTFSWHHFRFHNPAICSSMMLSSELRALDAKFPESSSFKAIEDYALWLMIASETKVAFLAEPLLAYLDHPQTSIRKDDDKREFDVSEKIYELFIGQQAGLNCYKWSIYNWLCKSSRHVKKSFTRIARRQM